MCELGTIEAGLEALWQIAHMVDYKQTVQISRHPDRWNEASSQHWIGDNPSRGKVNLYFVATGIGHLVLSCDLTKRRKVFQTVTAVEKFAIVLQNRQLGIKINF